MPFDDSRRLTGSNLFFASTGAVLELAGVTPDDALLAGWRARVERARAHLGWRACAHYGLQAPAISPDESHAVDEGTSSVARLHAGGATLAIPAPCDQLFTATEVNEWALCASLFERDPQHWASVEAALVAAAVQVADGEPVADPPVIDEAQAMERFMRLAHREARPDVSALMQAAEERGLPQMLDDETLTLGAGAGGRSYPLEELPAVCDVPWPELGDIPCAIVTGSNGKTTTVRLVAACARAHGWNAGYNCTDGVVVGAETVATGDYAGPAGARRVMRDVRVEAAIIEAARGGILRRGIAIDHAGVAVVTNVSADHFGEYGIHDLEALADVKLTVASVVVPGGLLVLNADDALLRSRAGHLAQRFGQSPRIGWFALDADAPTLATHRGRGGWTCGVRAGRLMLNAGGPDCDLGAIAELPLAAGGGASYNVANLAGAALTAAALGIPPDTIATTFAGFGRKASDNPGRLMRFDVRGMTVLVDYAHNPDGIRGLLEVAQKLRGGHGRLGMLLGHAGNRQDRDFEDVARVAAAFHPDLVVVKEEDAYLRGRAPGEVPGIIRAALLASGMAEQSLPLCMTEMEAVHRALEWARPGDVLALPVHAPAARAATLKLLEEMRE